VTYDIDRRIRGLVTRREFSKTLGLGGLAALAGCGGSAVPPTSPPQPNVAYPEIWGAAGDGATDDGPAFIRMFLQVTHGTTIWLSPGKTYLIGASQLMEARPKKRILKLMGVRDLRITGGGGLKRADYDPEHLEATLLFLGDCISPVVENVTIDGNRVAGGNTGINDVLVFNGCTGPQVRDVRITDSTRHGINFTECSDVRWNRVVVEDPLRYGISHDRTRGIVGADLVCTGSAERSALEFTNGCSEWDVQHVEANGCRLGGLLIGEHEGPGQSNRNGLVSHLTVRGGERGITIQGDTGVGNYNEDIRLQDVEVRDVTENAVIVGNGRRIHISAFTLRGTGAAPAPRGVLMTDQTSDVTLEHGLIQGCGTPVEANRVGEVTLRGVAVRDCHAAMQFLGCERVTGHDLEISGSRSDDHLCVFDATAAPDGTELVDFQRVAAQDNAVTSARFVSGPGQPLARLVWLDNRGITLDVEHSDGVAAILEIVTNP
jgi:hypothetical protein